MTPAKHPLIIEAYLTGQPVTLIARGLQCSNIDIYTVLRNHGVEMRGRGHNGGEQKRYCPSHFWAGFLIRPSHEEGIIGRAWGLGMIKIEEFNPIGTL